MFIYKGEFSIKNYGKKQIKRKNHKIYSIRITYNVISFVDFTFTLKKAYKLVKHSQPVKRALTTQVYTIRLKMVPDQLCGTLLQPTWYHFDREIFAHQPAQIKIWTELFLFLNQEIYLRQMRFWMICFKLNVTSHAERYRYQ